MEKKVSSFNTFQEKGQGGGEGYIKRDLLGISFRLSRGVEVEEEEEEEDG